MTRPINAAGLALIKSFENFSAPPYQDKGGVWTIGYGETQGVGPDTPPVTEPQALAQLGTRMLEFGGYVEKFIRVTLSDNEYAALVSLTYNAGTAPLVEGLGKVLNAGDKQACAEHFLYWNKEDIDGQLVVSDGLTRRREAERELFLTPDDDPAPNNID
jgi:lysozyme